MSSPAQVETRSEAAAGAPPRSVVLVGPLPPPEGGMANQTRRLASLLAGEGCEVKLVQVNAPYRPAWIAVVPWLRALFRAAPYAARLWRATGDAALVHVMANSGWSWHLCAAPAVWIARLRRVPAIVHYHGGEAAQFLERQFRYVLPTMRSASAVIVPSPFLREVFASWNIRADVVPNSIDLARFRPGARSAHEPHAVVARNLEDIYDIPTAIRAFAIVRAHLPHARLSVAGSGPRLPALQRLCGEMGLGEAVTFTGRLEGEKMAELYGRADLLLNPSLADNMPVSILEALASGVAVVSTNVGGIPHFVENERTALLVPPADPPAMAAAALRLLRDEGLAARLRANGMQQAQSYSWSRVREGLLAVYARALGPTAGATCLP